MNELRRVRVRSEDTVFHQYLPGNMHRLLEQAGTVCVGVIYRSMACGAALAECTDLGEYHLRYIFVDPAARLCGVGTYLLRGLLGELKKGGAFLVKAVYSPGMLEENKQNLGILSRAGFSAAKPISTAFSVQLGSIRCVEVRLPEGMVVYTAKELPEEIIPQYEALVEWGRVPGFIDARKLQSPSPEMTTFCCVDGELTGIFLIDEREDGLCVAGLHVMEEHRKGRSAAAMIHRTLCEARGLYPPDTVVYASAINRDSFSLCDKLFQRGATTSKETELLSIYHF